MFWARVIFPCLVSFFYCGTFTWLCFSTTSGGATGPSKSHNFAPWSSMYSMASSNFWNHLWLALSLPHSTSSTLAIKIHLYYTSNASELFFCLETLPLVLPICSCEFTFHFTYHLPRTANHRKLLMVALQPFNVCSSELIVLIYYLSSPLQCKF
jgi:hypothetical protein